MKQVRGERFTVIIEGTKPGSGSPDITNVRCDYEVEYEGISQWRSLDVTTARANSAKAIANNCFNDAKAEEGV